VNDRRARFFLGAAVVCGALIPLTPSAYQWLPVVLVVVYVLLSLASWLDARERRKAAAAMADRASVGAAGRGSPPT
jgi:hypothetical protein